MIQVADDRGVKLSIDEIGDEVIFCHSRIPGDASKLERAIVRLRVSKELANDEFVARFAKDHCLNVQDVRQWLRYYRNWQQRYDRAYSETHGQGVRV